jgi:AmmeMemoRadiSam system protein B
MESQDLAPRPRLRQVEAFPVRVESQEMICLRDPESFAARPIFLNQVLMYIVARMDGTNTLRDIQADFYRATGEILPYEDLEALVRQLDEHCFLESESFRQLYQARVQEFRDARSRPAFHAGTAYPDEEAALQEQLSGFSESSESPGEHVLPASTAPLRGLISPHIDFARGGPTYARAYGALAERPGARTFIIFGTCHTPMRQRFALTLKNYESPLGDIETEREFVECLAARTSADYFLDEFSHRGEHSIEFQAVWLKHVLRNPFRIVPILVGSFHDLYEKGDPAADPGIRAMISAVRETMERLPGPHCVIAAADLAHVGRRFGDPSGPTESSLRLVEEEDRNFLERAVACDAEGAAATIAASNDRRRVCGYPPIYMTLRCLEKAAAALLQYRQWADLEAGAAVTFAAVAFH